MRRSLFAAAAFAAAGAAVWAVAFHTTAGARADATVLARFLELDAPGADRLATQVARLADPVPVAVFTLAIAGVALWRRGVRLALAASAALIGANVSTQALKMWTAEPRPVDAPPGAHVAAQSWPSGHATAAATIALCFVIVAPRRLRPPAAMLAGAFALAVACSVLVLGWHLPSDAIGGFCVAATWTLAAVALARRRPCAHAGGVKPSDRSVSSTRREPNSTSSRRRSARMRRRPA
jgi:membrane-associated phospholipid phosphatase